MRFSHSKQMTFNAEWAKISPVPHIHRDGVVLKKATFYVKKFENRTTIFRIFFLACGFFKRQHWEK